MSDFSDYLQKCMQNQNLTLKEAAELTGLNYSLLSRFIHGSRLPKNVDIVKEMANGFKLNYDYTDKLIDLYFKEKIGKSDYEAYKELYNIMKNFDNLFSRQKTLFPKPVYKNIQPIEKKITPLLCKQDIIDSLSYSLIYFSTLEKVNVYAIMQPHPVVNEAMINHPIAHKIKFQQILCIDQNNQNSPLLNLKTFKNMMSLSTSAIEHEFFYFFDSVNNHVNTFNWMPNLIIIEDYAIRFDSNLSYGELITNPEQVNFFKEAFEKRLDKARKLTTHLSSAEAYTTYLFQHENQNTNGISLHHWPCIGPFLSPDHYERYLTKELPNRDEIIASLSSSFDYNRHGNNKISQTTFTKINGFEEFLQNGLINEFPRTFYSPLEMDTRLEILDRTIESIKEGWYQLYIVKEDYTLPRHAAVFFTNAYVTIKNTFSDNIETYIIEDTSFCKLLKKFTDYCIENNFVYSKEESLDILINIRKRFT